MLGDTLFKEKNFFIKTSDNLNLKKTEASLDKDLTFRLFSQLNLDLLFDMRLAFGHVLTEWKDTNKVFSLAAINHRSVFNLESTILGFRRAFWFLSKAITSYRRTSIMFVSGLPKYDNFNEFLHFHSAAMPLLGHGYAMHWIPGILTNFYMLISNFWGRADIIMPRYSKQLKREWFFESLRGVKVFHTFPNFVCFFSTSGIYEVAIKEALLLKIPTIAFVDSDQEVLNITFPIVGNDDSLFGLEVKIFLFRELLVRSLKKFLFSEIEQLIIEQNDLRQVVFQNYFSDRFREMLGHEKTQFFLRMQKKTREGLYLEAKHKLKKRRFFFFSTWISNLRKMSLSFLKKNVYNFGVLKGLYKKDIKIKNKYKCVFNDDLTFRTLDLFFVNLIQIDLIKSSDDNNNALSFVNFTKKKIKNTFFLRNFFIFVKNFFVLKMLFNFIYSTRILYTKEQLKLYWLFFVSYEILKKTKPNVDYNFLKLFLNFIDIYKNFSNFSVYFLQFRLFFFSNLFASILFKVKNQVFFQNILEEGFLHLEKKFSIKRTKNINLDFIQSFLKSGLSYAALFFSKNFYIQVLLNRKKTLNVALKKTKKKKISKTFNISKKLLIKQQQKLKRKSDRVHSYVNTFLKVKNKNVDAFLAKHLVSWKLYKIKRRKFFVLEKKIQKQTFYRLVLLKFNTIFSFFPSVRVLFFKKYKRKKKVRFSGLFERNDRRGCLKRLKVPFLPNKNKNSFWFQFKWKSALFFYIKKNNLNKFAYPYKRSWHNEWVRKKTAQYNRRSNSAHLFLYNSHYYKYGRKKTERLPKYIYQRYFTWLRAKPFLSLVLPKFFVPRYPNTLFYTYTAKEFSNYYQAEKLFFVFDFLNYVRYKKKLLLCFLDIKNLVKNVIYTQFKQNLCNFFCLIKNNRLRNFFLDLKKQTLNINILLMMSKIYNLILLELNVLLKKEVFNLESVHLLLVLRFFYYLQKIFIIFSLDKSALNSIFLQIKLSFFSKLSFNKIYLAFFNKNLIKNFFFLYKNQKRIAKSFFKVIKNQKTNKTITLGQRYDEVSKSKITFQKFLLFLKNARKNRKNKKFRRLFNKFYRRLLDVFFNPQYGKQKLKKQKLKNNLSLFYQYCRLNIVRFLFSMYLRYCNLVNRHHNIDNLGNLDSFYSLVKFRRGPFMVRQFPAYTRRPRGNLFALVKKIMYGFKFKAYKKKSTLLKKLVPTFSKVKNQLNKINSLSDFSSNVMEHLFNAESMYNLQYEEDTSLFENKKKLYVKLFNTKSESIERFSKLTKSFYANQKSCLRTLLAEVRELLKKNKKAKTFTNLNNDNSSSVSKNSLRKKNRKKHRKKNNFFTRLKMTPTHIFSLRALKNLGFSNYFSYIFDESSRDNFIEKIYKKRPVQLNFIENLLRFKKDFDLNSFFDYREKNFMVLKCHFGKDSEKVNKLPQILINRPRNFKKYVGFNCLKNRGFFVKVLSYRLNLFNKNRGSGFFYKKDNLYKYNTIHLPILPQEKNHPKTSKFNLFYKNMEFSKNFGRTVNYNFKSPKIFNESKNFLKKKNDKLDAFYLENTVNYKIRKRKKPTFKYKKVSLIFKKFRFYFQKLKKILFKIFNNVSLTSLKLFDKIFVRFFSLGKKPEINSLVFKLIKQSFFVFLYRIFLSLKVAEADYRKAKSSINGMLIRPRNGISSHFSYNTYLNTKNMLPKNKVATLFYLFFKLKKAREFYFLNYGKILGNQQQYLFRSFNKKDFRFLKVFY